MARPQAVASQSCPHTGDPRVRRAGVHTHTQRVTREPPRAGCFPMGEGSKGLTGLSRESKRPRARLGHMSRGWRRDQR